MQTKEFQLWAYIDTEILKISYSTTLLILFYCVQKTNFLEKTFYILKDWENLLEISKKSFPTECVEDGKSILIEGMPSLEGQFQNMQTQSISLFFSFTNMMNKC